MMNLQDKYICFGKWSCLAQCYIYAALHNIASVEERENKDFMESMVNSILLAAFSDKTLLDDECTVLDGAELMNRVSDKKYKVEKLENISSALDLPMGYAVVNFERTDEDGKVHNHWVLFKDQKQLYNSLAFSYCVACGKIASARVIYEL